MVHSIDPFMEQVLRLAAAALEHGELPIAALIVLDGRGIAAAHTAERAERRLLAHAELLALDLADRLAPFPGARCEARLYTTLEPCLMCLGAAMSFMLGEIHYALESPADGAVGLVRSWRRDEPALPGYRLPLIRQHRDTPRQWALRLFREYTQHEPEGPLQAWAASLAALR